MTTTAFDDQFTPSTQTIESVHAPYEPVAILKRNVAELELALKRQTERAEKTEAELAKLREQKPVAWCDPVEFKDDPWSFQGLRCRTSNYPTMPLYAAPVPAPAAPYGVDDEAANRIALAVYDCKNGINPEPLLYAINRILGEEVHPLSVDGQRALLQSSAQAPAVPAEIIELSKKYAIDTEAYHAAMDALLQSAEVRHD